MVRLALQDAASIASLILTTEAIIAARPDPAGAAPTGDGMGGMGGMGGYDDMGMGGMGMPSAPAPAAETDAPASEKSSGKSKTIGMATGKNKPKAKSTKKVAKTTKAAIT